MKKNAKLAALAILVLAAVAALSVGITLAVVNARMPAACTCSGQCRSAGTETAADVDAPDRPARHAQPLHHAERGEGVDGGVGEAEVALVEHLGHRAGGRRLDHRRRDAGAVERDRQAGAHQAAADDQDRMHVFHHAMIAARQARAAKARVR